MKLSDIKNSENVKVMQRINNQKDWCYLNTTYEGNEDKEVEKCWQNSDGNFIIVLERNKDKGLRYYTDELKKELYEDYYRIVDESKLMGKEEWEELHPLK